MKKTLWLSKIIASFFALVIVVPTLTLAYPPNISSPTFSLSPDSPSGAATGGTNKIIFKFRITASPNYGDIAENKVIFKRVDLTTLTDGVTVQNVKIYPADFDLNINHMSPCSFLTQTKWQCNLNDAGATNEIIEGTTKTYIVRADIASSPAIENTLWTSIEYLGEENIPGDVIWSDGTNDYNYVDQVPSQIKSSSPLYLGPSSGSAPNSSLPYFSINPESPSGVTTGSQNKTIFKFDVTASEYPANIGEDKVILKTVNITTVKYGVSVKNLKLYPAAFDLNSNYVTFCGALSQSKWRCQLNTAGATNEIIEGTTKTFVVRADIGSGNNFENTLETSIAYLGTPELAGDVTWNDGADDHFYVSQYPSEIKKEYPLIFGSNSGTFDTTGPSITQVSIQGTADNKFTANDTVLIKWNETIDPTMIITNGGSGILIPNGQYSVTNIPGSTGYLGRSSSTQSKVKIPGIFDAALNGTDLVVGGNTTDNGSQLGSQVALRLSTDGKELTIKVLTAGNLIRSAMTVAENFAASTPTTGYILDANGNDQTSTVVTPTGNL